MTEMIFVSLVILLYPSGSLAQSPVMRNITSIVASSTMWNYDQVNQWGSSFPMCSDMQVPSPIRIDQLIPGTSLKEQRNIMFLNLMTMSKFAIRNDGNTLLLTPIEMVPPSISVELVNGIYLFREMRLHWGQNRGEGSEHRITGMNFWGELQMFFLNVHSTDYESCRDRDNCYFVISILLRLDGNDNPDYAPIFNAIRNKPNNFAQGEMVETTEQVMFDKLFPRDRSRFLMYIGSLTMPPCSKYVRYIIYWDAMIGNNQAEALGKVMNTANSPMGNNFRPTMPINGRVVHVYRENLILKANG